MNTAADYGIDPVVAGKIMISGHSKLLSPFMIVMDDGDVISLSDEAELEDELKQVVLEGKSNNISYIFCDGAQMDLKFNINIEISPTSEIDNETDLAVAAMEAEEMDRQMLQAMAMEVYT